MAQDMAVTELADRIRAQLADRPNIREQKMFGGVAFMLNGNMLVGPMKGGNLLVRVGKHDFDAIVALPGAGPMTMGDRQMSGFVEVAGDAIEDEDALAAWIARAETFVKSLPAK